MIITHLSIKPMMHTEIVDVKILQSAATRWDGMSWFDSRLQESEAQWTFDD
jgi:hypothetical protein